MEVIAVAEALLELILKLVGEEKAKDLLSAKAVSLANDTADIVERERWPNG
jgi:hypothetical protein